jgi:hypothetical protein
VVRVAGTNGWLGANIVRVSVASAAVATIIGLAFTAWFHIQDGIAGEAKQRQLTFHAAELQREADDVGFEIYKVVHQLDEIEARAHNGRARKGDPLLQKQLDRELEILLRRQGDVLDRLEDSMKEK